MRPSFETETDTALWSDREASEGNIAPYRCWSLKRSTAASAIVRLLRTLTTTSRLGVAEPMTSPGNWGIIAWLARIARVDAN